MTPIKRTLAAASVPALLALSLSACGGGSDDSSGSSDSASSADFCKAVLASPSDLDGDDLDKAVAAAHDYANSLKDVGTPSDMSDSERNGFEKFADFLGGVSTDDVKKLSGSADTALTDAFGDDAKDVEAYIAYTAKECAPDPGDLGSDLPSGLPT